MDQTPPFDPVAAEPRSGFQELMGFRLVEWRENEAVVELQVEPRHLNRAGVIHGGVLATLLDSVLGYAGCWCPYPGRFRSAVTLSLTTAFTGQVSAGRLRAVGRKGPGGTRIYVCTGEVADDKGLVLATAQGTFRYRTGSERPEGVPRPARPQR